VGRYLVEAGTFICEVYRINLVFVRVTTDAGLHGVGEATLEYRELTLAAACRELERTLKGRDPHDVEAIWHDSYRDVYWRGGPVKDAVGDRCELLIEAHRRFNIPSAIRAAHALEDYRILWFEEPVPPDSRTALAEVKRRTRVPIAAGERIDSRRDYSEFLDSGCCQFVQPDVCHVGGISEMKKIAAGRGAARPALPAQSQWPRRHRRVAATRGVYDELLHPRNDEHRRAVAPRADERSRPAPGWADAHPIATGPGHRPQPRRHRRAPVCSARVAALQRHADRHSSA
jgi:hypothetical protein